MRRVIVVLLALGVLATATPAQASGGVFVEDTTTGGLGRVDFGVTVEVYPRVVVRNKTLRPITARVSYKLHVEAYWGSFDESFDHVVWMDTWRRSARVRVPAAKWVNVCTDDGCIRVKRYGKKRVDFQSFVVSIPDEADLPIPPWPEADYVGISYEQNGKVVPV